MGNGKSDIAFTSTKYTKKSILAVVESLERVFIALGSNIRPRGKRLAEARAMLQKISLGGWKESPIYETPPVGPADQGFFFNQVVSFWYGKGPRKLLHYLKGAELFWVVVREGIGKSARLTWTCFITANFCWMIVL